MLHLAESYGPWGLFFGMVLDYFGVPIPGETLLFLAGGLSATGSLSLVDTLLAGISGSLLGSWLAYRIGRKVPRNKLIRLAGRVRISEEKWQKAEGLVLTMRVPILLFSRYLVGVRQLAPYAAGVVGVSNTVFNALNTLSALLWCVPVVFAGRLVGSRWPNVRAHLTGWLDLQSLAQPRTLTAIVVGALLAAIIVTLGWRKARAARAKGS